MTRSRAFVPNLGLVLAIGVGYALAGTESARSQPVAAAARRSRLRRRVSSTWAPSNALLAILINL